MKATLLEQMKRDYIHIKHTKTVTRQQVERQEEVLHPTHGLYCPFITSDLSTAVQEFTDLYFCFDVVNQELFSELLEYFTNSVPWILTDTYCGSAKLTEGIENKSTHSEV